MSSVQVQFVQCLSFRVESFNSSSCDVSGLSEQQLYNCAV